MISICPQHKLKLFQKGVLFSGIETYNHLPLTIKELSYDVKWFRWALKRFIHSNSFYSLEEYFDSNWKWVMLCLFVNHISIFTKWYAMLNTLDVVSLYFKCIESLLLYIILYWQKFSLQSCVYTTVCLFVFLLLLLVWLFPYRIKTFTEK